MDTSGEERQVAVLVVAGCPRGDRATEGAEALYRVADLLAAQAKVYRIVAFEGPRPRLEDGALGVRMDGLFNRFELERAALGWRRKHRPALVLSDRPLWLAGGARLVREPPIQAASWGQGRPILAPSTALALAWGSAARRVPDLGLARFRRPSSSERLELLHPGPVHRLGGQHLSVEAVSRLPAAVKARVRLTLAGVVLDGVYAAQLRVAAEGQPVRFVRSADEAHLILQPQPSPWAAPLAALDAVASQLPLIWCEGPAAAERLLGVGVAVAPGDVPELRDRLVRFVYGGITLGEPPEVHAPRRWRELLQGALNERGRTTTR